MKANTDLSGLACKRACDVDVGDDESSDGDCFIFVVGHYMLPCLI